MNRISRKEYDLVRDAPVESPDNEIRVKANRRRFVYVAYIVKLLEEGKHEQVTLIGSGMAIQVLLDTIKLLTTRVKGVHSCLKVEVSKRVMKFVPREEFKDLKPVEKTSTRTSMKATISLTALDCITKSDAYMAPEDEADLIEPEKFLEIIKEYNEKERNPRDEDDDVERRGGRGRGRGGRGRGGRGRGRGGRGRGGDRRHYDNDYERSRSPRRRGRGGRGRNDHYNRERNDDYERRGNDRRHHDNDDDYRRNN